MKNNNPISLNIRELGDYYRQEADNYGDYVGQYGWRKTQIGKDGRTPIINLNQDFVSLPKDIKKIQKAYKIIKKSMMAEKSVYCSGKTYID